MYVLGLTAPCSWNTAAALVRDGELIAAAEEERFVRIKHAPYLPPIQAATYCLREAGITIEQVDAVAIGWRDPLSYWACSTWEKLRGLWLPGVPTGIANTFEYLLQMYRMRNQMKTQWNVSGLPRWVFVPHHLAHAASTYCVSGFEEANVLTIDGNGEDDSGWMGVGRGKQLTRWEKIWPQQSLGFFYENATDILGFKRHSHEGKTMGLAGWGKPELSLDPYLSVDGTNYHLQKGYVEWMTKEFGPKRKPSEPLLDKHRNYAYAVQSYLEKVGVSLAKKAHERSGLNSLCLAGGVALNCDMNAKILEQPFVDQIFIQPAAHDAGVAIGSAMVVSQESPDWKPFTMKHAYWGPAYSDAQIEGFLKESGLQFTKCDDIASTVADLLANGKIVGWFQGRMELGPRALGARSILAHPALPGMKDRVNQQVKHRETWRPFAPSILHEAGSDYVENYHESPFMLITASVKQSKAKDLLEATHVDGTVRLQSVTKETHPVYHQLLEAFRDKTGIPAILNTSFNDQGEPLVASPKDAVRTYYSTGLDALALGSYLLEK